MVITFYDVSSHETWYANITEETNTSTPFCEIEYVNQTSITSK